LFVRNLSSSGEKRVLPKSLIEVVNLGGETIMRVTFQPGWKWSDCIKPVAGTDSCLAPHINYVISGRMIIKMDNGIQKEIGPGDAAVIPPGHDAWVVGEQEFVAIDFGAGKMYGKSP